MNKMDEKLFSDLKISLNQAIEHAQGKRKDLRTTTLPRPPKVLTRQEIISLRERFNVSQNVFARCLNISVKTLQGWEQGLGKPSGASLKLLELVARNPDILEII